jgi:hypothetical protein
MPPSDDSQFTHSNDTSRINHWGRVEFNACIDNLHWGWFENKRSDKMDSLLSAFSSEPFSSFNQLVRGAWIQEPLHLAAFLGAIRRYRILYPPSTKELDISTIEGRAKARRNDPLLEHLATVIVMLVEEDAPSTKDRGAIERQLAALILRYEYAMIEKVDGNRHHALELINELIEQIDHLGIKKPTTSLVFHQLFTFENLSKYADFQRSLIRSSLGKNAFGNRELVSVSEDIVQLHSSLRENMKSQTLVAASQVRYFFHMESLLRRDFGGEYLNRLKGKDPNLAGKMVGLMQSLIQQETNKSLTKLQAPRIKSMESESEEWYTTGWMIRHYCENISNAMSMVIPNRSIQLGKNNIQQLSQRLIDVGDLSKQNPYNQNPTDLTNLTMFQPKLISKIIHNRYKPEDKNRVAFSMMAMTERRPKGINFANTLVDAAYFHSIRVEKMQTIPRTLSSNQSLSEVLKWGLRRSTGHLVDLSLDARCDYAKDNVKEIERLNQQYHRTLDFMNHFLNSYYPVQLFSLDKKKQKGFTKTMHVNRLNALGKGLTELMRSFAPSSSTNSTVETMAEKSSFNILPSTCNEKDGLLDIMMLQSLFVISRLDDLVTQLAQTKAMFLRTSMPKAFRNKIQPLLEKYAYYLAIELIAVRYVTETLAPETDMEKILQWLEEYANEVIEYGDIADGKKSRHPIFQNLVDEKLKISQFVLRPRSVQRKLNELQQICSDLSPKIPAKFAKEASLENFYEAREQFGKLITRGEYSGGKILTSNLLSARLIQQFVDQMTEA